MYQEVSMQWSNRIRRLAITLAASAAIGTQGASAGSSNDIVLVPPAGLPELARKAGEAMFLREAHDGRTVLYIEQDQGTVLAILDVTDPRHVKSDGSVRLDVPGVFDFISDLGSRAALIRFRQGQGSAVLDFHDDKRPSLKIIQGIPMQGSLVRLGNDGFAVTSPVEATPALSDSFVDTSVIDIANLPDRVRVFDVKRVREEITNEETGTTFLLADDGLYLVRRPSVERDKESRELAARDAG